MMQNCFTLFLVSAGCLLPLQAADRDAEQLFPKTTVLYAEIPNPPELISAIFDHPIRTKIEALEPYQQAIRSDGYRTFLTGRKFAEIQLGMKWREALETVLARGVYFGVDGSTQGLAVLVHAKDASLLELFRSKLLEISRLGKNPDQIKEGKYRSIAVYEVNNAKFAVVDDWLLITNKPDTGKAFLDRLLDGSDAGESLADNQNFQQARSTQLRKSTGWGFADVKTLRDAGIAKRLYSGKSDNPVIELLAGGILNTLQHTPFATLQLTATHTEFGINLSVPHSTEWITEEREYYFGTDGNGHGPALPTVANTLFTLSAYRDISEMWLRAGDLFNERINDGFAEADANLTTFFSGKDFGEDILGSLTPQIGFIASKQDFSNVLPAPTIKLPQFALVLELREPETMTRELRRTFQSMIGFFNVIGAMQGNPQLEMDMNKLDGGAELITSTYIPDNDDSQSTTAPIFFNFSPSVGFDKERFIVASTDRFARELIESRVTQNDAVPLNTSVRLQANVLQSVLSDNRDQLISQNMLEEGHSRDEAENAIGLLLQIVGYFKNAIIKLDTQHNALSLQVQVQTKTE